MRSPYSKLSGLCFSEVKELAVLWCYYLGKIEGKTYTYVEKEALLKDGVTSEKSYTDAKMLQNLYNTFIGVLETTTTVNCLNQLICAFSGFCYNLN